MKDYLIISNTGHKYFIKNVIEFKEETFNLIFYTKDKVHMFNSNLVFKIEFDIEEEEV